jgi:hypothetical protein
MESFAYGKATQRGSRRRPLSLVIVTILIAAVGAGIFTVTRAGGEAVVGHTRDTTEAIGAAGDAQAQANLRSALSAAMTAFMDGGSFENAGPDQLSALEPGLTYVDASQPSTGANVVSIQATDQAWGAAALSSSGTCFFIRTVGTAQAFGSGDPCTGQAAMGATASQF